MSNVAIEPVASEGDRLVMRELLKQKSLNARQHQRLQIVVARLEGRRPSEIADMLGLRAATISETVARFNRHGVDGLLHPPRKHGGGKQPITEKTEHKVVEMVKTTRPKNATHWSLREIAKSVGISATAVHTILRKHNLKPHLVKRFRTSDDPQFAEKLSDVVGLYLNPPENAIVLCVDEKSQIQALERMQPILPLREGVPERQTHDYHRHGTTTLFAALAVATGRVIGATKDRHRAVEYIEFLKLLDKKLPKEKTLHIVADNVSSHKTKEVQKYLDSRPGRFVIHYTPTHSSWLNLIERWFAELTNKRIRRESWEGKRQLEKAILDYIHHWNRSGKNFTWTKTAGEIMISIEKAMQTHG